ncbi:MAG: hypothetical protein AAB358_03045 [Patescibacteria group bacterium]
MNWKRIKIGRYYHLKEPDGTITGTIARIDAYDQHGGGTMTCLSEIDGVWQAVAEIDQNIGQQTTSKELKDLKRIVKDGLLRDVREVDEF